MTIIYRAVASVLLVLPLSVNALTVDDWFEDFKRSATDEELYSFLYALPKGGDLHNHLTGSNFSEWWYELATHPEQNGGYRYYTRVTIENCAQYGSDMFGFSPYLMYFRNIQESGFNQLSDCEKSEYKRLEDLTEQEKDGWLNSLRLDKSHESRDEFFQTHWQRLNDLTANPHLVAQTLYLNMQAFAREGVTYLESIQGMRGFKKPDGSEYDPDTVADIFRDRLNQADARQTGVTVRLQYYLLRFIPNAEEDLAWIYHFVDRHRDLFVGINMVGREDNDKGYPLRFLPVLRSLRQKIPTIPLAIHAGEVDEPNHHVRDTLLLGASRIGHGVNLISDPDTLLMMRNSEYLVEINLISNLLLQYVNDFSEHPFPEYLRLGIPVALSTDDRGMWDSNLTDEYFVAVKEFNLSWRELVSLGRNSLRFSFLDDASKADLLDEYEQRVGKFSKAFQRKGLPALQGTTPVSYGFSCRYYSVCLQP
ncbi:hypothetical protein GCM10027217_40330 [Pseudomaricurvus hydrocarbonicus]